MSRRRRRRRRARASAVGFSSFSARLVFFFFRFAAPLLENTSASVRRSADVRRCFLTSKLAIVFRRRERGSVTQKFGTVAVRETPMKIARPIDLLFSCARLTIQRLGREASLVFHTEDWRELGAGRLCVWERKRPARLLERRQRRARKHTFDRRSHVSRAASSSRASVRSSAFKRNLPRRGVRRCAAAHAKPHARRPAGVA